MNEDNSSFLEVYKIYVQTAENISEKRLKSNSFYLALCSALVTVSVTLFEFNIFGVLNLVIYFIGMLVSIVWLSNIKSYKSLNSAKYQVIHNLEKNLPIKCFYDEWEIIKQKKHRKLSDIEGYVPIIFIIVFLVFSFHRLASLIFC